MNSTDDQKWRSTLKRHDPAILPNAIELAVLERRIMARVDALPDHTVASDAFLAPWTLNGSWAARGICLAAVLFVLLGFAVGRDFNDLFFQTADSSALFASADGTPWQSFITAPSSGENDDAAE